MSTVVTEFGMRTTRLIPGKCEFNHDKYIEAPVIDIVTKVDPVGYWLSHSYEEMRKNCDLMKIYILWPILMSISGDDKQQQKPWDFKIVNMIMKDMYYFEILEDLADLFKKVATHRGFIEDILRIGNKMDMIPLPRNKSKISAMAEAINWVQTTADQTMYKKLMSSHERLRSQALFTFFLQYSFLLNKMGEECCTLTDKVKKHECYKCDEECKRKKLCGNIAFDKEEYNCAIQYYTAAMQYSPHNHFLFSNRALCYIRLEDLWHAVYDGKKAVVLKSTWPKGHYRFCEALFLLGQAEHAMSANKKAQELCKYSPDGIRDLVQQHARFIKAMELAAGDRGFKVKKIAKKKIAIGKKIAAQFTPVVENKDIKDAPSEDIPDKESTSECTIEKKECSENVTSQQPKKGKAKGRWSDSERLRLSNPNTEIQKPPSIDPSQVDLTKVQDTVKSLVREAYEALNDKRCRNAEGIFSKLLDILGQSDLQSLHLTKLDYLVLQYGHANALLGIGQCVELVKAENQFKVIIQHHSKERFNCLAFYGIGNVYFRQNRFSDALNHYIKSKTMVNHKMLPGILTWPTTSVVIEETRPEKLQVLLDNCIEECKFPPKPDAICRYEQCLSLPKAQIYFSDPDFKGFIRMVCCQFCRVEFHVCCWKKMKASLYSDKNDKDFLKYTCLTPDCRGFISHIVIFDSMAQVKCEFEEKTLKRREPQRSTAKHKITSKSNKMKHENKSERKKAMEEESVGNPEDHKKQPQEAAVCEAGVSNGYRVKWDPLLAQVLKKEGLIKRGCPMCFPSFWESVCVWRITSVEKLEELDRNSSAQASNKMNSFLTHLYKLNDRVKTRVFLYLLLLQDEHITASLHEWLLIVNSKGLEAAVEFRDRNIERLKNIKPENVINLWNESYGKNISYMMDCSSNNLLESLASMNVEGFRCFLWLLEENKHIASEHGLEKELDRYFREMDIPRGEVPKQSFENYNNICMHLKAKHKKKKRNQPVKPTYKLSGAVSTRSQEEDIFTEENTLSLLDPNEPFLVPESLRTDVDDFETFYELGLLGDRDRGQVADFMEPIKETLYEYFSQILDEYGPLKPDDERLIGEYKDFPEETHRMVEEAGGLKNFLLQSYEFTIVDDTIALSADYDIPFREQREKYKLNPTAQEFKPSFTTIEFNNGELYSVTHHDDSLSSDSGATECNELPVFYRDLNLNYEKFALPFTSPHLSTLPGSEFDLMENNSHPVPDDDDLDDVHSFTSNGSESYSIDDDYDDDDDDEDTVPEPSTDTSHDISYTEKPEQSNYTATSKNESQPKHVQTGIVSVQVDIEYSHHDVNTEPFQPFETQQGEILRMEKEHKVLREQLQEATDKYDNLQSRYNEEISVLEEQIRKTVESNKIAKTELLYLQQEYENETKKWQQERKENQDKLKARKNNIKSINEANDKYARGIEEKKKHYEACIEDFAKIQCSKFENEKAKLEKQISTREAEREEVAQRSAVAEVMILENTKQTELLKLKTKASNTEQGIKMLKPMANSNPATLEQISTMESYLLQVRKEMDALQSEFDEKITTLKKTIKLSPPAATGRNLPSSAVLPVSSPASSAPVSRNPSPSPVKPSNPHPAKSPGKKTAANKKGKQKAADKPQAFPASNSQKSKTPAPSPAKVHGAGGHDRRGNGKPETKPSPTAKPTLFDKIIEELRDIFPHYKSADLASFIKDFRVRNNGTLSGLTHEEIICRVTEHILDCQARSPPTPAFQNTTGLNASNSRSGIAQPTLPQPKQPWRVVTGGAKSKWQNSNDLESFGEDPCIICHDELKQFPVHKLDCGHYFHKHCIKTWLHTQSTCPTCREHALLPEDFPVLSGRMRTAS